MRAFPSTDSTLLGSISSETPRSVGASDATLRHLQFTLAFDWAGLEVGARPVHRGHRFTALTAWRAGRADSAPFESQARRRSVPVSWAEMRAVQASLALPSECRAGHAGCADRFYGHRPHLGVRFARKVDADAKDCVHPVVSAVRLFLDIIHVHPFEDGTTRSAVLWLAWGLDAADWPLPEMGGLLRLPKASGDPGIPAKMLRILGG